MTTQKTTYLKLTPKINELFSDLDYDELGYIISTTINNKESLSSDKKLKAITNLVQKEIILDPSLIIEDE